MTPAVATQGANAAALAEQTRQHMAAAKAAAEGAEAARQAATSKQQQGR